MRFGNFKLSLFLVLALSACSSSPPTEGESAAIDISTAESRADSVGSIPEDMIEGQPSDPFADLAAAEGSSDSSFNESSASALAVIEGDAEELQWGGSGNYEVYSVKAGDTLMKIAFSIYGDIGRWKDLQELNSGKITNTNALRKGMKLKYETPLEPFQQEVLGHSYEIKSGDTLAGIADEVYGKRNKYKKLQRYNARLIRNPNRIYAGFTLYYDINEQEMAEAEARRQSRMASGTYGRASPVSVAQPINNTETPDSLIPSAVAPIPEALPPPSAPPVATAPGGGLGPEVPAQQ